MGDIDTYRQSRDLAGTDPAAQLLLTMSWGAVEKNIEEIVEGKLKELQELPHEVISLRAQTQTIKEMLKEVQKAITANDSNPVTAKKWMKAFSDLTPGIIKQHPYQSFAYVFLLLVIASALFISIGIGVIGKFLGWW